MHKFLPYLSIGLLAYLAFNSYRTKTSTTNLESGFERAIRIEDLQVGTTELIAQSQSRLNNLGSIPLHDGTSQTRSERNQLATSQRNFTIDKNSILNRISDLTAFGKTLNVNEAFEI